MSGDDARGRARRLRRASADRRLAPDNRVASRPAKPAEETGTRPRAKPFAQTLSRAGDLPLFWKLLLPGLAATLTVGIAALFFTTRFLVSRTEAELDRDLFGAAVDAEAHLRDTEVDLIEASQVAANLVGVPGAVATANAVAAAEPLLGLTAVRQGLDLVAVTDRSGTGLVEITRSGDELAVDGGRAWNAGPVAEVLGGASPDPLGHRTGLVSLDGAPVLAVAGPVMSDGVVGAALAGVRLNTLAMQVVEQTGASAAFFAVDGTLLGAAGDTPPRRAPERRSGGGPLRVRDSGAGTSALYESLELGGERLGTLAVAMRQPAVASAVRGTALWLTLLVGLAIAALVALYTTLSHLVTRDVRHLADVSRRIGRGDLSARAGRGGDDELGELARRLNTMADHLQVAQEDMDLKLASRTEELRRLYREAAGTLERERDAFSLVSHELRNPLFAVLAHAELMADPEFSPDAPDWCREYAGTIQRAAEGALEVVNNVLSEHALGEQGVALQLEPLSLGDEVRSLEGTIRALAHRGDLAARIDVDPDLPAVNADRERVRQILQNLVSNAVKYTPAGGSMWLRAHASGDAVELSVGDTGVGIPAEALDQIFEPFYRVEGATPSQAQPRTGLGLSIVKRLVEAQGGEIRVESEVGRGSTFTVSLAAVSPARSRGKS